MRLDDGDIYVLPTLAACCVPCRQRFSPITSEEHHQDCQADSCCHQANTFTSSQHVDPTARFVFSKEQEDLFLTLKLEQLPLLTEDCEQTPIGARGWYSSAVLAAMLLCGHETLHKDIFPSSDNINNSPSMMIELGSGTVGLVGMMLAWIVAQANNKNRGGDAASSSQTKIVLTDYDPEVLAQLEKNVQDTSCRLAAYFGDKAVVPQLEAAHLDWNEYDQDQPLLMQTGTGNGEDNDGQRFFPVTFVCGAALVYTEETEACADQVAKILKMHPQAAVWVVQWPRKGWFQVFQMQLQQKHNCEVQKFAPSKDIHPHIHNLAQRFMQPQIELDVEHIKAVRITSSSKIEK
jgi:Lysine methyltransferase